MRPSTGNHTKNICCLGVAVEIWITLDRKEQKRTIVVEVTLIRGTDAIGSATVTDLLHLSLVAPTRV